MHNIQTGKMSKTPDTFCTVLYTFFCILHMCVSVCVCVCVCGHMLRCGYILVHFIHKSLIQDAYILIIYIHMVHVLISTYAYVYAFLRLCVCVCLFVCLFVCMRFHIQ
jgi:hypothetical protein